MMVIDLRKLPESLVHPVTKPQAMFVSDILQHDGIAIYNSIDNTITFEDEYGNQSVWSFIGSKNEVYEESVVGGETVMAYLYRMDHFYAD